MDNKPDTLVGDFVEGAEGIAVFVYGEPVTPEQVRKVYYWIERGYLKVGRMGNLITASRRSLREQLTGA